MRFVEEVHEGADSRIVVHLAYMLSNQVSEMISSCGQADNLTPSIISYHVVKRYLGSIKTSSFISFSYLLNIQFIFLTYFV